MALEDILKELTAATKELVAETKALRELRADAIETVKSAAAPASTKSTKKEEKVAETKAETKAETPAPEADPYDEAKGLIAQYTTGSDRPEEVQARKEKIKGLLRHEKLVRADLEDASKFAVTDVKADALGVFVKNVNVLIERGDITQPAAAAASDDLV